MGSRLIFLHLVVCDGSRESSVLIGLVPAVKEFCVWILDEAAKNASEAKMFRDVA